eukprot:TRINITY_DN10108_c0_g1_i2.p1 TRINITY_DN10108_c0_g1~~TRINITY_DN10108_c0_g1_i2.p1  ORF type:complete len:462 (+),score=80.05 TRINITY_DN10108_c0_g1_i2:123-1388(+)
MTRPRFEKSARVLSPLEKSVRTPRPEVSEVEADVSGSLGVQIGRTALGHVITDVVPGGPAHLAGIRAPRLLLALGNARLKGSEHISALMHTIGKPRRGVVPVTHRALTPAEAAALERAEQAAGELPRREAALDDVATVDHLFRGAEALEYTVLLRVGPADRSLGLFLQEDPDVDEVYTVRIEPGGVAERAGVEAPSLLLSVGDTPVHSVTEFDDAVDAALADGSGEVIVSLRPVAPALYTAGPSQLPDWWGRDKGQWCAAAPLEDLGESPVRGSYEAASVRLDDAVPLHTLSPAATAGFYRAFYNHRIQQGGTPPLPPPSASSFNGTDPPTPPPQGVRFPAAAGCGAAVRSAMQRRAVQPPPHIADHSPHHARHVPPPPLPPRPAAEGSVARAGRGRGAARALQRTPTRPQWLRNGEWGMA